MGSPKNITQWLQVLSFGGEDNFDIGVFYLKSRMEIEKIEQSFQILVQVFQISIAKY